MSDRSGSRGGWEHCGSLRFDSEQNRYGALVGVVVLLFAVSAGALDPNPPSIRSEGGAWPIVRQWTHGEVKHYAEWVEGLYRAKRNGTPEQRTANITRLLRDPEMNRLLDPAFLGEGANPPLPDSILRTTEEMLDCGKLTIFLPTYYAYRRALPWMVSRVAPGGPDPRIAPSNTPLESITTLSYRNPERFFIDAVSGFSSGNYRIDPESPGAPRSDTVPVALRPGYLQAGCVNYITGHCLLLAHVTPYGELGFLQSSTSRGGGVYTHNGMNTVYGFPGYGGGDGRPKPRFEGLRVFRWPLAELDENGVVTGIRRRTDAEMIAFGYSVEQYAAARTLQRKEEIHEGPVSFDRFHDFIRFRMRTAEKLPVLAYMENFAGELVDMFQQRDTFVQTGWADVQENGPIVYPEDSSTDNIFQAHGRWETWSSPSSDVDRRNMYFFLRDWALYVVRWYREQPEYIDLSGFEKYGINGRGALAEALVAEKNRIFAERRMHYRNSRGEQVSLTLADIEARLHDLSFDPNHPPELRWGAPKGSAECRFAPETFTATPGGAEVPMWEAYRSQTFWRSVSRRATGPTGLRGMPVRQEFRLMFDDMLAEWYPLDRPRN